MPDPPGYFPLIVRGGRGLTTDYEGDTLRVQFHKSPVAAGDPTTYNRMPIGSAAWVDRPVNAAEPVIVRQQMSDTVAEETIAVLRNEVGFWKFVCRNTNAGDFEAIRSERVFAEVKID